MKNNNLNNQSQYELVHKPNPFAKIILWGVLVLLIVALLWAKFAIIDEYARGQGKVIPSSQVQVIQNLEGGIVQKIFVKEGQIVQKGQILMQLDKTRFESAYAEDQSKAASLQIKLFRLMAQVNGKPFNVTKDLANNYHDQYIYENDLYKNWIGQKKQLQDSYELALKELNMSQPLVKQGAVSPVDILHLQQSVNQAEKAKSDLIEETLKELNDTQSQLKALQESMSANLDRLQRTTITSPVKGIVKQIKVTTIGGVSQPGMDLMEIVPLDDTLLVEAQINPQDIGFIHIGQKAFVKISAYDFSIYGGMEGTVEQISADSIKDDKDKNYYLIRVRTQQNYLGTAQKPLYIIPGMTATVDILTGKKSVLSYLLKPILKIKDSAFKEK